MIPFASIPLIFTLKHRKPLLWVWQSGYITLPGCILILYITLIS